ncbi:hypothetical protein [Eubacterium limosum]|uniref:hypothetical protein n=1 Tax=Eubacterium limosum TaxID=1736 RepID=UPI0010632F7A|nr:hypothetical protein [Eubacterium limosum]
MDYNDFSKLMADLFFGAMSDASSARWSILLDSKNIYEYLDSIDNMLLKLKTIKSMKLSNITQLEELESKYLFFAFKMFEIECKNHNNPHRDKRVQFCFEKLKKEYYSTSFYDDIEIDGIKIEFG